MKLRHAFAALLALSFLGAQDSQKAIETARAFFDAVLSKDVGRSTSFLDAGVHVRYFSKVEMKKKIDAMINNEIKAMDYLKDVTGFNVHKFAGEFDGRVWEVSGKVEWPRETGEETLNGTDKYLFVKFQATITETQTSSQQSRTFKRTVEIDLRPEGDGFKVFGFIL